MTHESSNALAMAGWPELRIGLAKLLSSKGLIPLSNVKNLFAKELHLHLSETALGFVKGLLLLFADPRLADVCVVMENAKGKHVILPPTSHMTHESSNALAMAGWPELRFGLAKLLSSKGLILLWNVKALFAQELHLHLSETALGFVEVRDLFADPRLADVCVVMENAKG